MSIKHKKHVFAEDGTDPNAVHPSDWNDDHILDGFLGLFADLGVGPDQFPYIKTDGTGALAPVTVPARNFLAQVTPALMLAAIGAAGLDSPAFTNTPTAPTPALGLNTDQIATMAALKAMRDDLVHAAPGTLDTLKELADAIGDDPNFAATMTAALGNRLRFDAAQSLTTGQKAQAIANLALAVVAASGAYADLTGKPTLGTAAALNVGTAASQVVQLDGSAKLPAVDGSQLVNLVAYVAQALTAGQKTQARTNIAALGAVKVQVFNASGTYTPSAGMVACIINCVGGGGGGAGAGAPGASALTFGGGGGSGGYSRTFATAAQIGASQAVAIGAGGNGGAVGANNGLNGGATSVGTLCVANGGGGGATTGTPSCGQGGAGGGAGTGDITATGNAGSGGAPGGAFSSAGGWGGMGGASILGGAPVATAVSGSAAPGSSAVANSGAGGVGGGAANVASGAAGGNGGSGKVFIIEFCTQ
jgi:hypothetical protein